MRPELEQLAQVDAYVNESMSAAEKAAFETEMHTNPALQEAVETQQLLVTAVNRKALMAYVTAAAGPTFIPPRNGTILSRFKWPIILSSIFIGAVITWLGTSSDDTEVAKNQERIEMTEPSSERQNSLFSEQSDSLAENTVDFTYKPTARTTSIKPTYQREFGGLETWVAPEVQQVVVDPSKEELIECKDGTLILVPKNAFADADGNAILEPVTLEIIEALTMDKMVAYNLATMSNGEALKSGGMVYVQPTLNGTELALADGKSLHIEIPTDDYDPSMKAWEGVANGKGDLNWENPKEIENYLIPVSMNSLEFLPEGFREEVAATLPFKKYQRSSKRLEDSLYYSLGSVTNQLNTTQHNTEREPVIETESPKFKYSFNKNGITFPVSIKNSKAIARHHAIIQFDNIPPNKKIFATIKLGKSVVRVILNQENYQLSSSSGGKAVITIQEKQCNQPLQKKVQLNLGEITYFDCSELECGENKEPLKPITSATPDNTCYINPSSVYAAHTSDFENTFIATREFQERLQALHKVENAQPLFDLYINQLDKNLFEIDKQVAARLTGDNKIVFEKFEAQKLTNVKPDGQNYNKLKQFYTAKVKEQQQEIKQKQREYNQKSAEELSVVQTEIAAIRSNYLQDQQQIQRRYSPVSNVGTSGASTSKASSTRPRTVSRNPQPKIGSQPAYKVNWYGTGWMNIDAFLHELSKGEKQIPIAATSDGDMKVYQSINSLNTLLSLNNIGGEYTAHFPSAQSPVYSKSMILGVSRNDGKLKLAARFLNPYTTKNVTLNNWEEVSEDEFKRRLKELYPAGESMLRALAAEEKAMQAAIERKARAEEQRKKKEAELKALEEQFKAASMTLQKQEQEIQKRQVTERAYVQHLVDFVDPCSDFSNDEPKINFISNPITTGASTSFSDGENATLEGIKWDDNPEYPGGYVAMTNYFAQNIQYPQEAFDQNISGRVYMQVTLDNRGKIQEATVIRSEPKSILLENEAIRLVMTMPNWNPAKRGEIFVPSRTTFHVSFVITD